MPSVVWTSEALVDLDEITLYVGLRNHAAAERLAETIWTAAEQLALQPFAYRPGREPTTREAVVHPNYIVVYTVGAESVRILRVLHASRQYP
ncbi:type II toxin-antitoxin system RelE/ParE family toxin [Brevundimonas sp.]|uniref:type II toxin-antitoxin system RelE/ParE family toxin n=1 Tax=Brevundimonas sp. TaxID=1871086 RepID=UPI002ABBA09B|nr:type II toxin-antitoxin system RelE/ParE family toxin [Brevundimonas sp.]MDZ4362932.1 type II toxin-antitoxin system RelE/ParE family toxin [Brevundimonas sp.]